jgi:hypothetical protein
MVSSVGGSNSQLTMALIIIVVVVVFVTVFISFNMHITPSVDANLSKLVIVIVFI